MPDATGAAIRAGKWLLEWLVAARNLGAMRRDIEHLKMTKSDPRRCSACGKRLTVTASEDLRSNTSGEVFAERLSLRCDTPGCVFTPRQREVYFTDT